MLVRQTAKQEGRWASHRLANVDFRWPLMPIPINFPLQFCIDPNHMCPVRAHVLGKQMVFIGRCQAQTNWPYPAFCKSASFPENVCSLQDKEHGKAWTSQLPRKLLHRLQSHHHLMTPSVNYIFICLHIFRTATLLAFSITCWHILSHSHSQDFTQICHLHWHPLWDTSYFYMSVSKLSHLWGSQEIAKVCSR